MVWSQEGTVKRVGIELSAVAILAILAVLVFNPTLGPNITALRLGSIPI